jgi:hypothetical protein
MSRTRGAGWRWVGVLLSATFAISVAPDSAAQELTPAAYTPAPSGINVVNTALTVNSGDLTFVPTVPIEEASAQIGIMTAGYIRTFGLAGRSANVNLIVPYLVGDLEGLYLGEPASAERAGLGDMGVRLAVNLLGAPAMSPKEFAQYRPKTLIGASLVVKGPTGQYDSSKLINIGTNRWSFKPEVGFVQVIGKWAVDAFVGAWLFTDNGDFLGGLVRRQDPILSTQFHIRRVLGPKVWAAVAANFWYGGETTVDGATNDDRQENSRVGLTVSWAVARNQSIRFAASRGAITRIGGDFDSVGVSYSYSWMRKPTARP